MDEADTLLMAFDDFIINSENDNIFEPAQVALLKLARASFEAGWRSALEDRRKEESGEENTEGFWLLIENSKKIKITIDKGKIV